MPAPSTLGTLLRAFTFGHVRQLDALLGEARVHAWRAGAGPGDGRMVIDWTASSARCADGPSKARPTGTRRYSGITRSSPPGLTLVRCCTSACARVSEH